MKIKISRNIRKYLIIYLALILILYLVIEMVPRVTNIFETTQILEPGNLVLTCEAEGYLVKTETISTSEETGSIEYLVDDGTAVRKKQKVVSVKSSGLGSDASRKYADLMEDLKGYDGIASGERTPISGIFSLTMDGCEKVMNPANLDTITYEKVKDLSMREKDLSDRSVSAGDPMYKVTDDDKWYAVCWLEKSKAKAYSEGQQVRLQLPSGTAAATVRSITKEEKLYKIVFSSDMYYKDLASTREVDMTIINSDRSGLIVDNGCIIQKDGKDGVYVRDKNGDYYFVRVNVIETDGKESVISESSYIDLEGNTVYTVSVYDEVLKNPEKALKKELKEEEKEKKKKD